ncbi:MAG: pyridoxal phosphate-dependent aminotransferase [Finegoldia sp.]|nr:pyridoxal phosphate-dependent aminotransferase [Finegoldia sp.]
MLNQTMLNFGKNKLEVAELTAYGVERAKVVGTENILDFTLGNPSVDPPKELKENLIDIVMNMKETDIHSYTPIPGFESTRKAVVDDLNERYGTSYTPDEIFLTAGSSPALSMILRSLITDVDDEIILIAPFYAEYTMFVESNGGKVVTVPLTSDFCLDIDLMEKNIGPHTKAIIVNSPSNPSGVIYTKEELEKLGELLERKSKEYGNNIYIISDEPYRDLVFEDIDLPWIPSIYKNTVVLYSWSKSLSLPGERIGYILVPSDVDDEDLMDAVSGAARSVGHFCAPSLMQHLVERCIKLKPDLTEYRENRDLLYKGLTEMGYEIIRPEGAFYLFIKSPDRDGYSLSEKAKKRDMLIAAGREFGDYESVRLSYCVPRERCERALPIFKEIMDEFSKVEVAV